jgi:hypothetical protein
MPVTGGRTFECETGISAQKLAEGGARFCRSEMTGQLRIELKVQKIKKKKSSLVWLSQRHSELRGRSQSEEKEDILYTDAVPQLER